MSKIVLVDDERDILDTTAELLRIHGYDVAVAQESADVMGVLRRERPDLLLQDCAMPGLDLDALIGSIRGDSVLQGLPIFLFTGSVNARTTAQRLDVAGFIEKPFDFDQLRRRIERAIPAPKHRVQA